MLIKTPYIILPILLLLIIYHPIVNLGFANVDDPWAILGYKMISLDNYSWPYFKELFTTGYSAQYAPINVLLLSLVYKINGYDPYWFHLFCFTIHLLNVWLLYEFLIQVLTLFRFQNTAILAFACSVIWSILPFNVESVVWISASKIPLYGFFSLLALIFFLIFFKTRQLTFYIGSLLSLLIACFCKEQAVLISLIIVSLIFYSKGIFIRDKNINWYFYAVPYLMISLVFGIISINVAEYESVSTHIQHFTVIERLVFVCYCFCFYILNTLLPIDLHYHYPFPISPGGALPLVYYIFPVSLSVFAFTFYKISKKIQNRQYYYFSFSIFLFPLLMCVHLVPIKRPAIMADRYMYISSIGILMIIIPLIGSFYKFLRIKGTLMSYIFITALFSYIIILITYSHKLVLNWFSQVLY